MDTIDKKHIHRNKWNFWFTDKFCNEFYFVPVNVGNGVALNVKYKYKIDTLFYVKYINKFKFALNSLDTFYVSKGTFFMGYKKEMRPFVDFNKPDEIPFLLNYSKDLESLKIKLPETWLELISLQDYLSFIASSLYIHADVDSMSSFSRDSIKRLYKDRYYDEDCPPISLEISYEDINKQRYTKSFNISLKTSARVINGGESDMSGVLSVKRD